MKTPPPLANRSGKKIGTKIKTMYAVYFDWRTLDIVAAVPVGLVTLETYVFFRSLNCSFMTPDQIEKYLLTLRNNK